MARGQARTDRAAVTAVAALMTVMVALAPMRVAAAQPVAEAVSSAPTSTAPTSGAPTSAGAVSAAPTSAAESMTPTPRDGSRPPAFTGQDNWTTPKPGPKTANEGQTAPRAWRMRQAPLAGAEASWGPPGGQMPEYAEFTEPQTAKGPPSRGTARIVSGAILGPIGLGLAIAGVVGATTSMLGDHKRLSVPMIGVGLVSSAIGWGLLADGLMRRKRFMRWQEKGGQLVLAPVMVPGQMAGLRVGLRF